MALLLAMSLQILPLSWTKGVKAKLENDITTNASWTPDAKEFVLQHRRPRHN